MNRLTNGVIGMALKNSYLFSTAKKAKMELTVRTPYKTILDKFDGFSRIVAKTNEVIVFVNKVGCTYNIKSYSCCSIHITTRTFEN